MIKADVIDGHVSRHPDELNILRRLEPDFEITWGSRISAFNTQASVYFLKPLPHISQAFGFEQELLLAISSFPVLEARLIQAIEQNFDKLPAKGRVDQTVALIVSKAGNISTWLRDHIARNPQARAYVGIPQDSLLESNDAWYLRNILVSQLFSRDLFEYTLPLNEDLFFFGRQAIVAEHIDSIRKSENRGLFGLRKTGKTSVLFKLKRQCDSAEISSLYYDCKLSHLYNLSGNDFIDLICEDLEKSLGEKIKGWRAKKEPSARFFALVGGIPRNKRICLMFDEIEYISFNSVTARHWERDFIPFWQTLWSVQSQFRKFCFIISGVNASIIELDKFNGIQNPMFGIVKARYLTGFEKGEVFSLVSVLGRRMGLNFQPDAVDALYKRYGGHPLLTRMICSQINTEIKVSNRRRPVNISSQDILRDVTNREHEIQFYCGHITSELEDFYTDEYEILELLASGNINDFNDMTQDINMVRHLRSYGLVDFSVKFMPKFAIPVIQGYIASKWMKKNNYSSERYVVPMARRQEYVTARVSSILRELRYCEKKFEQLKLPPLYRGSGPAEAELFAALRPITSNQEIVAMLNQCNRSLIEPLDRTGESLNKKRYFYVDLCRNYPLLWPALNRIRTYRNYAMHANLNPSADKDFNDYIKEDFDEEMPGELEDGWFRMQSAILDGLITGIQSELGRYF